MSEKELKLDIALPIEHLEIVIKGGTNDEELHSPVDAPEVEQNVITELTEKVFGREKKELSGLELELEKSGVTLIDLEEGRGLYLIEEDDISAFHRMKNWKEKNQQAMLEDCINQFEKETKGDAFAKILYDYQFPDFILKFSNDQKVDDFLAQTRTRRNFERLLLMAGLVLEHEADIGNDYTYVKIWAPFHRLCEEAHYMRIKMPLDIHQLPPIELPNSRPWFVNRITIHFSHKIDLRKQSGFFKKDKLRQYHGAEHSKQWSDVVLKFWSDARRNLLTHHIIITSNQLRTSVETNGKVTYRKRRIKSLAIRSLLERKLYVDFFPLHDGPFKPNKDGETPNLRAELYKTWIKVGGRQPIEKIREYFGEKLALYFAWLGFYTLWLSIAAVFGLITVIFGIIMAAKNGEFSKGISGFATVWDNALTFPHAFLMAVWATLFLETWKRYNAALVHDWNISEYGSEEQPRPEFYGTAIRVSPITAKHEVYFPFRLRFRKLFVSIILVGISMCIVIVTIGVLLTFSRLWVNNIGISGNVVSSVVNLITVLILDMLYRRMAIRLTDFENHRTLTAYEDSLNLKTYLFDFVNFYSGLFYILLLKEKLTRDKLNDTQDGCQYHNCMSELTIQLAIILIGKQAFRQIEAALIPWLRNKLQKDNLAKELFSLQQRYIESSRPSNKVPPWARDDRLISVYGEARSEYEEIVVQFGFISLFATAFPLAALCSCVSNIIEIRSDAFKHLITQQRVIGFQAQNIGIWEPIIHIVSLIAVLTNAIIIAFHSSWMLGIFRKYVGDNDDQLLVARLAFIIAFEHLVFFMKALFIHIIPDIPKVVRVAMAREQYMARLALENEDPVPDESFEENTYFNDTGYLFIQETLKSISDRFD